MMIYRVEEGFIEGEINSITNEPYDSSWIVFCLTTSNEYQIMNGGSKSNVYTLRISKNYTAWKMSVMDFLEFQESLNKNIILSISETDWVEAKTYYEGHHYNEKNLRKNEPEVVIHSTTPQNWESIQKDGCLKSWNTLKKEKEEWEKLPIGSSLGDPSDFSDYIMFADGGIASEIVVLSKQKGQIIINQEIQYEVGTRLYFDMKKIAQDGLLVRDGCHFKVKDKLPLKPYLIWVGDWRNVGLNSTVSTPKEFTKRANDKFEQLFEIKIKE